MIETEIFVRGAAFIGICGVFAASILDIEGRILRAVYGMYVCGLALAYWLLLERGFDAAVIALTGILIPVLAFWAARGVAVLLWRQVAKRHSVTEPMPVDWSLRNFLFG